MNSEWSVQLTYFVKKPSKCQQIHKSHFKRQSNQSMLKFTSDGNRPENQSLGSIGHLSFYQHIFHPESSQPSLIEGGDQRQNSKFKLYDLEFIIKRFLSTYHALCKILSACFEVEKDEVQLQNNHCKFKGGN